METVFFQWTVASVCKKSFLEQNVSFWSTDTENIYNKFCNSYLTPFLTINMLIFVFSIAQLVQLFRTTLLSQ